MQKKGVIPLSAMIDQMRQAESMGGIEKIAEHLPHHMVERVKNTGMDNRHFKRMEAVFLSMTPQERDNPGILRASRKQRIAEGAGVAVQMVNQLLRQHEQAQKLLRRVSKNPAVAARVLRGLFN